MPSTSRITDSIRNPRTQVRGAAPVVVRPVSPAAGSCLARQGEELAICALRLEGADPGAITTSGDLVRTTKAFSDLLQVAHLPGQAMLAVDLAAAEQGAGGNCLEVHLLVGLVRPQGGATAEARALLGVAQSLLARHPACYETAAVDPRPLLEGLAGLRHGARILQRRVGLNDEHDQVEVLSRFDREADDWLCLAEVLLDQVPGTRIRTTLLASELDLLDWAWLDRSMSAAQALVARSQQDAKSNADPSAWGSGSGLRLDRVRETLIDLKESFQSPTFVVEVAVASPAPLPEVFLRAVGSSITNELDVIGRGDTPTVAARKRLVGGFDIERDPEGLLEALRIGLPLRGGLGPRAISDVVSLTEAACAFQWPVPAGRPIPTIRVEVAPELRPPAGLAKEGAVVGRDSNGDLVHLDAAQRASHLHLIGTTGTGKTTLIARLVAEDLEKGEPFVVIDPHGDLAKRVAVMAAQAGRSVVVVDSTDPETAGLELFDGALTQGGQRLDRIEASVSRIVDAITSAYDRSWTGPRFRSAARAALMLLACSGRGHHLGEVGEVLGDRFTAQRLAAHAQGLPLWVSRQLDNFAEQREQADVVDWVTAKFSDFSHRGALRRVLPPIGEGMSIPTLVAERRSLIVNLAIGTLSVTDARMLGHLAVSLVVDEALARPPADRRALSLYVDEAQILPAASLARALAEGRKFGLSLAVAHQHLAQLDHLLLGALDNAQALFAFRLAGEDAHILAPRLGLPPGRLMSLPNLTAYARLSRAGRPLAPFSVVLDPPEPDATNVV